MYCTKCGHNEPEGMKFCSVCGAPLTPAPTQEPAGKTPEPKPSGSGTGKAVLIGVLSALLILAIAGCAFFLIREHKQAEEETTTTSMTTEVTTEAITEPETTAPVAVSYLADPSLLTDTYINRYKNDLMGRLNTANNAVISAGFSKANDVNHVQAGHTHNSLCFVVASGGSYKLYEYADIRIDSNNQLMAPTYKGCIATKSSWGEMNYYLADKGTDTYHYDTVRTY